MTACIADKLEAENRPGIADSVRAILSVPDDRLDYARVKLALDALVDPSSDVDETMAELDRMATKARRLAGKSASEGAKLGAIRQLIYESGPWNGHRPFDYDHADPLGTQVSSQLIANYLQSRRGQCVSMPILFLVLAEKLGVELALAAAPHHVFVRYTDPAGRVHNIETTSGGHPARDEWFHRNFPMSDRAIENGLYMRTLNRREGCALMATTLIAHLWSQRRYEEMIAVATVVLEINPRDGQVEVALGSAHAGLIQAEFADKYPLPILIPAASRPRYRFLCRRNEAHFARAEAFGCQPDPDFDEPPVASPLPIPQIEKQEQNDVHA